MKKIFLILFLLLAVVVNAQTSRFQRNFTTTAGAPLTGFSNYIWIVPQANTYPTGALALTEDGTRPGVYYRLAVPDGEYKIYIDTDKGGPNVPILFLENYWVGEQRLSTIANHFDPADSYRLFSDGIKNNAITTAKINDGAITNSKLGTNSVSSDKILSEAITSDKLASLVVTAGKLGIDAVTTSKILNGTITQNDLSQALIDYINAAGGGSITNNPDDITLETKPGSKIGIKDSWLVDERARSNSVFINDYIGSHNPVVNGWSLVFQDAVDANLGTNNTIVLAVGETYELQLQGDNPYEATFGSKMCIDLKTGGFRFYIPATTTLKLKASTQTDVTGPIDIMVFKGADDLTIDGGGTIDANSTNQPGWTGGYGQIAMGGIIYGYGTYNDFESNNRIVIKDLALENCFSNPINLEWVTNVTVDNCSAHRFGEGMQLIACKDVRMTNNLQTNFYNTTYAGDGYETSSCQRVIFSNNRMYGDGVSVGRGAAGYDCFGTQDAVVANNEIIGFGNGFTFGNSPGQAPSNNILVIGNLISGVEGQAMEQGQGKITYIGNVMRNAGGGAQFQGKVGNNPEKPDLVFVGNEFDSCVVIVSNNIRCVFNGNTFKNNRASGRGGLLLLAQVNNIDSMYVDISNNTFQDLYRGLLIDSQGYTNFTPKCYITGNTFRNAEIGGGGGSLRLSITEINSPSVVCENNILPTLISGDPQMDLNLAIGGYTNITQTYNGATAKALSYVPYNAEVEIYFKLPAIVLDMRNTTGGNFMLNGGKDDLFQAGQRLHLTFNSDSNKWYEDWRTFENENKVMNRLIVADGWSYTDVTASLGTTSLGRFSTGGTATQYFVTTRPCYLIAFGGSLMYDVRTAGTLTIGLWWSDSGPNYTTTIDGTNTHYVRREFPRNSAGLIPAGTRFHISISTDGSWAPTTADFMGFVEFEY